VRIRFCNLGDQHYPSPFDFDAYAL
jgi:hypothetical protein